MIEIASSLMDADFNDIKDCATVKETWVKIILIHDGHLNVLRAKDESLSGKYDEMRMKEGENIVQYSNQIKEVGSSIKVVG